MGEMGTLRERKVYTYPEIYETMTGRKYQPSEPQPSQPTPTPTPQQPTFTSEEQQAIAQAQKEGSIPQYATIHKVTKMSEGVYQIEYTPKVYRLEEIPEEYKKYIPRQYRQEGFPIKWGIEPVKEEPFKAPYFGEIKGFTYVKELGLYQPSGEVIALTETDVLLVTSVLLPPVAGVTISTKAAQLLTTGALVGIGTGEAFSYVTTGKPMTYEQFVHSAFLGEMVPISYGIVGSVVSKLPYATQLVARTGLGASIGGISTYAITRDVEATMKGAMLGAGFSFVLDVGFTKGIPAFRKHIIRPLYWKTDIWLRAKTPAWLGERISYKWYWGYPKAPPKMIPYETGYAPKYPYLRVEEAELIKVTREMIGIRIIRTPQPISSWAKSFSKTLEKALTKGKPMGGMAHPIQQLELIEEPISFTRYYGDYFRKLSTDALTKDIALESARFSALAGTVGTRQREQLRQIAITIEKQVPIQRQDLTQIQKQEQQIITSQIQQQKQAQEVITTQIQQQKQIQRQMQVTIKALAQKTVTPTRLTHTFPAFMIRLGGAGETRVSKRFYEQWFKKQHLIKTPKELKKFYDDYTFTPTQRRKGRRKH